MRFALAVLVSGLVQMVPYYRTGMPALLAVTYIALAATGAGFFAGRHGWLAGALSVLVGAAAYGVLQQWGPGAEGGGTLEDALRIAAFVLGTAPYAVIGTIAGAAGTMLRSRVVGASR